MVRDGEIAQSTQPGGLRHFLQTIPAVGRPRMGMEIALQILQIYEVRESPGLRRVDLSPSLSQFRWNPGQTEGGVDRFLRLSGDRLVSTKHAIFIQLQTALLSQLPEHDVVRFTAGEIEQRRSVTVLRHDSEIHLQTAL